MRGWERRNGEQLLPIFFLLLLFFVLGVFARCLLIIIAGNFELIRGADRPARTLSPLPASPGEGKIKKFGAAAQKKEVHQSEGVGTAFWGATAPIFLLLRPRRFRSMFRNNYCWKY